MNHISINGRSHSQEKKETDNNNRPPTKLQKALSLQPDIKRIEEGDGEDRSRESLGDGLEKLETIMEYPESMKRVTSSPEIKDLKGDSPIRGLPKYEEFQRFSGDRKSSIENCIMINSLREMEKIMHSTRSGGGLDFMERKEERGNTMTTTGKGGKESTWASFQMPDGYCIFVYFFFKY